MPLTFNSEGRLIYTLEIEINLLDFNPQYPKNPKNFGERIRKKRIDLGLTIKEIAQRLGVSETTVYNWEIRGVKPYRKIEEKLKAILDTFGGVQLRPSGRSKHTPLSVSILSKLRPLGWSVEGLI